MLCVQIFIVVSFAAPQLNALADVGQAFRLHDVHMMITLCK